MGQQIKACSDLKRLAVVAADDPSGPVYLLQVTPAALKGLNAYQKELSMRGIAAEIVRTRISFDTDASFPKLKFGFGGFLDEATMVAVDDLFGSDKVKEITGEATGPEPVAPAPAPRPAPVKAAAPAPVPAAETPKRGFGAKPAAAPVQAAAVEAAPAPAPKAAPKKAAPVTTADASSLADDIANMLEGMDADD